MTVEEIAREVAISEIEGADNSKIKEMIQMLNQKIDKK